MMKFPRINSVVNIAKSLSKRFWEKSKRETGGCSREADMTLDSEKTEETSQERPKSVPFLRLNKLCENLGNNENVISELWER